MAAMGHHTGHSSVVRPFCLFAQFAIIMQTVKGKQSNYHLGQVPVDRALRFILIRVNQNNREQCSDTETGTWRERTLPVGNRICDIVCELGCKIQ